MISKHQSHQLRAGFNAPRPPALKPACQITKPPLSSRSLVVDSAWRRGGARATSARGSGDSGEEFEPRWDLESDKLSSSQLDKTERAIVSSSGRRITQGDLAVKAGMSIQEAKACLSALASDTLAELEVTEDGRIYYKFDPSFRSILRRRSLRSKIRPVIEKVWKGLKAASRFAFGLTLFSSILITLVAITAVLSSRGSDSKSNDRRGGGGGFISFYTLDPYLFLPGRLRSSRTKRSRDDDEDEMSFIEAVFSFVFGDEENYDVDFEAMRWKALGSMLLSKGSTVTEEELRPFLLPAGGSKGSIHSLVAPALSRLEGEAVLDEKEGSLLFTFPQLSKRPQSNLDFLGWTKLKKEVAGPKLVEEQRRKFSNASPGQLAGVIALALVNVGAVFFLNSLIADPTTLVSMAKHNLLGLLNLLPWLNTYASFFVTFPVIRWITTIFTNQKIDERNEARRDAYEEVFVSPSKQLSVRLKAARDKSLRLEGKEDRVVFSTSGLEQSWDKERGREWNENLTSRN